MNVSKEKFTELAKEHLIALESYKMDKKGKQVLEIFGIEKLYEAINAIQYYKSDSELLSCKHEYDHYTNTHGETVAVCSKCMDAYF
jgi:hypothetical protein